MNVSMKNFIFLSVLLTTELVFAKKVTSIPEVGPHYPLFTFEKNENPQNILIVYTEADKNCRLLTDRQNGHHPTFDFYWLMDGRRYKPVHPMIRNGIYDRLEVVPTNDQHRFEVRLNDLKEVRTDIKEAVLTIKSSLRGEDCDISGQMTLGPSDNNATIRLTKIYTEAKATILPPFRKIRSITLTGTDVKSGRTISRKYSAR